MSFGGAFFYYAWRKRGYGWYLTKQTQGESSRLQALVQYNHCTYLAFQIQLPS
jgi:hypothetical protein